MAVDTHTLQGADDLLTGKAVLPQLGLQVVRAGASPLDHHVGNHAAQRHAVLRFWSLAGTRPANGLALSFQHVPFLIL